jgi:hypothetical protein
MGDGKVKKERKKRRFRFRFEDASESFFHCESDFP